MKHHYTYRITNIKLNKHYYGVRSSKVKPKLDLGFKYFSSSTDTDFMLDQQNNKNNYKYKIVKTFETRACALLHEIKLHHKFNVAKNDSFYNKCKQTSTKFNTEGIKHTVEQNNAKSLRQKGNIPYHLILVNIGSKRSETQRLKMSNSQKALNKKLTIETKNLIALKLSDSNSSTAKCINIYDNFNILRFECYGNFRKICNNNNLPFKQLQISYINNSFVINVRKYASYLGWYARIV